MGGGEGEGWSGVKKCLQIMNDVNMSGTAKKGRNKLAKRLRKQARQSSSPVYGEAELKVGKY
jgi:hypothetical protein